MKRLIAALLLCMGLISCHVGDHRPPAAPPYFQFVCDVTTMASTCLEPNARLLTWIAPGDDGMHGRAFQYDVRWNTAQMTVDKYRESYPFINEPQPQHIGNREQLFLPRMYPGVPMSFGIRTLDEVANVGDLSITPLVQLDFIRTPFGTAGVVAPDFGTVVEPIGFINGLPMLDIAVGAPSAINPSTGLATGAVFIYMDAVPELIQTVQNGLQRSAYFLPPSIIIYGQNAGDQFGASLSGDSDFNGDGLPDLAVGAPGAGKAYVFLGGLAGKVQFYLWPSFTPTPGQVDTSYADITINGGVAGFGASIALLGETDARNGTELLIGSPGEGKAYLFYGGFNPLYGITGPPPQTVDLTTTGFADWTIVGPVGSDFGKVVARTGDINGDTVDDMIVTAPGIASVYLFYGGAFPGKAINQNLPGPNILDISASGLPDLTIKGALGSNFGAAISARRNVGVFGYYPSIAVGAPGSDYAYVFYGSPGGVLRFPIPQGFIYDMTVGGADQTFIGIPGTQFGAALTGRADLDASSSGDLLVGAPDAVRPGIGTTGAVFEFLSSAFKPAIRGAAEADYIIFGPAGVTKFGSSMESVGVLVPSPDITSVVLYDDFIVGAPGAGTAYIEY